MKTVRSVIAALGAVLAPSETVVQNRRRVVNFVNLAPLALACLSIPATAAEPDAAALLTQATDAMGGEAWLNPASLVLEGEATFYAPDRAEPVSRMDDYRMWRAMDPDRTSAHGADGKVRITGRSAGRTVFDVGYDGTTTWTDKGVMPKAQADAYWASNFGFGILRRAAEPGFRVERAPDRIVDGHPVQLIRVIDPQGSPTLFGLDADTHRVRYLAFATPRGFHERVYDDFVAQSDPDWVQARIVTLYYNGVKQNTVRWRVARVNAHVDPALFAPPPNLPSPQPESNP